ncbi:MAG TPA: tRNA (adenosine(37)-N6)-threonylcarbamoyltransferase complex dimerization subunit type 1 TsaB [Gammaproteobacteria bacterium]|nr:tRNA (adenosine(37)-N6)-threonylcarbamoyltransferase complex dimerization subunit type 1 TsaB [Gammaproteobacteria bacterium]
MKILALDTSSSACSIALSIDHKFFVRHEIAPMQQAKIILPLIKDLLEAANTTISQLDAIAFGRGPGSFTGVRIAVSAAQGLAYAANKPLISISSLAGMAQGAYQDLGWTKLIAAIDARMGEIYWGAYEIQENGLVKLAGKEQISRPEEIILPDAMYCGVGNAWEVYGSQVPFKPVLKDANCLPLASAILLLAEDKYKQGDTILPEEAVPVYLRDNVAKKTVTKYSV